MQFLEVPHFLYFTILVISNKNQDCPTKALTIAPPHEGLSLVSQWVPSFWQPPSNQHPASKTFDLIEIKFLLFKLPKILHTAVVITKLHQF